MQNAKLGSQHIYDITSPKFQTAFAFLTRTDLAVLPEGWLDLENGVRASIQHYNTHALQHLDFETHEKNYDIQYLVEGKEVIGVVDRLGLLEKVPYDAENDITFYHEPKLFGSVVLRSGDYVILAPEDAHQPRCAAEASIPVKKIVLKVPV